MFDNTHSVESWDFLEALYWSAGIIGVDFWKVMDVWRRPSGRIGPMKYRARVMNASGRDDTALANGILNGFATYLSACAAFLQKPLLELTPLDVRGLFGKISLSVCGDDSIGALPLLSEEEMASFTDRMNGNISMFGFEAKLEHSSKLSDAVYLAMRPYPVGGKWFWGKTIGRAVYKMGWVQLNEGRDPMAHITGIAEMHVLCSSHVPILSDMARKIVELRQAAKRTAPRVDENRPWEWTLKGVAPYDRSTLEAVASAYKVRVEEVLSAIDRIAAIERLPCVLDHPFLIRAIITDDL